ncbi:MAG: energy transducer TonB [Rhodobacteraceae bacterium]|nr:energy transducer TonB [Paracoccaceae bacterium]
MRRLAEFALFMPLAAGLHVVAFGLASGPPGGGGAGGMGGDASVTLAAAPPAMAALVRDWQAPPKLLTDAQTPVAPAALTAPALPALAEQLLRRTPPRPLAIPPGPNAAPAALSAPPAPARPRLAERLTPLPDAPLPDRAAQTTPDRAPETSPAPSAPTPPRPEATPAPQAKPAPARPATPPAQAQRAKGAANTAQSGSASSATAPALSPARMRSLHAEWGAGILARVTRHHHYPRGTRASGRALVELVVGRDGRLISARLAHSAGDAVLDRAALNAVHSAGRFPAAPQGLRQASYSFTLPLRFDWKG